MPSESADCLSYIGGDTKNEVVPLLEQVFNYSDFDVVEIWYLPQCSYSSPHCTIVTDALVVSIASLDSDYCMIIRQCHGECDRSLRNRTSQLPLRMNGEGTYGTTMTAFFQV
jgi:hypothetical protein